MSDVMHGVIGRYADLLPVGPDTPRISLGEGGTPCVDAPGLASELGLASLHFKCEGLNPTGSFKDRGMVMAIARALEASSRMIICASTGNTSASAAAYGSRYGLRTVVIIPHGKIATGKLAQARIYGARIVEIDGSFDDALRAVRELSERAPVTVVNSINPFRIEGQKTAAFEIVDELGDAPDILALPVGNAGNITAYWRGFQQYHALGRSTRVPTLYGAQAAGAAPLVEGRVIDHPDTVATAIRIGNPASWTAALRARDESGGLIEAVTDEEILQAQRDIGCQGIFCEPASAASFALLRKLQGADRLPQGVRAVCVLTGNGLKDTSVIASRFDPADRVPAETAALARALGFV